MSIDDLLTGYERGSTSRADFIAAVEALTRQSPQTDANTQPIAPSAASAQSRSAASSSPAHAVGVNHIAIGVSDLQRSANWYRDVFELETIQESADSVLLGWHGGMLVLRVDPQPGIGHFMFGVAAYDAEALQGTLVAKGLDPQKDSDSFHVRDPDGLNIQVGDRKLGLASGIVENGFRMS